MDYTSVISQWPILGVVALVAVGMWAGFVVILKYQEKQNEKTLQYQERQNDKWQEFLKERDKVAQENQLRLAGVISDTTNKIDERLNKVEDAVVSMKTLIEVLCKEKGASKKL